METSHVHAVFPLVNSDLLKPITKILVHGMGAFSAIEKFKIGTQDGVKIGFIDDTFKKHFLLGPGKIEIEVVRVHELRTISRDAPIIGELGPEILIETTLFAMWQQLMKRQGLGRQGILLVNGYANIFYIRDDAGTLWAVRCSWDSGRGYWDVGAFPVTGSDEWCAGCRVFSR